MSCHFLSRCHVMMIAHHVIFHYAAQLPGHTTFSRLLCHSWHIIISMSWRFMPRYRVMIVRHIVHHSPSIVPHPTQLPCHTTSSCNVMLCHTIQTTSRHVTSFHAHVIMSFYVTLLHSTPCHLPLCHILRLI